jgi:hypothetical protein
MASPKRVADCPSSGLRAPSQAASDHQCILYSGRLADEGWQKLSKRAPLLQTRPYPEERLLPSESRLRFSAQSTRPGQAGTFPAE